MRVLPDVWYHFWIHGRSRQTGTRKLLMNAIKSRSRMSLSVDVELRKLLADARRECGERTASKAIRWALKKAVTPAPSVTLGLAIIRWAEGLQFLTPKEQREMRALVAEMYRTLK